MKRKYYCESVAYLGNAKGRFICQRGLKIRDMILEKMLLLYDKAKVGGVLEGILYLKKERGIGYGR